MDEENGVRLGEGKGYCLVGKEGEHSADGDRMEDVVVRGG